MSEEQGQVVFVVDDDEAVRKGISLLLKSVSIETETFGSAQEFLDAYNPGRPGCLVLDVRMPGMSGLDLQDHLAEQDIQLPIVIVTGHGDVPMAVRAVKMGAVDLIEKPFRDQVLLECVQKALQLDKELRKDAEERARIKERLSDLTPREHQIMQMVVTGKPNKVIAKELGLSQKTVEFHRAHVMAKTEAGSVAELVRLALKVGASKN
ncbi:MAG: response regulator transcription factor [Sedimentisphaerales bacterium]|nr:response regulator transcription factor [Sedimentisphaerales bacterium]